MRQFNSLIRQQNMGKLQMANGNNQPYSLKPGWSRQHQILRDGFYAWTSKRYPQAKNVGDAAKLEVRNGYYYDYQFDRLRMDNFEARWRDNSPANSIREDIIVQELVDSFIPYDTSNLMKLVCLMAESTIVCSMLDHNEQLAAQKNEAYL